MSIKYLPFGPEAGHPMKRIYKYKLSVQEDFYLLLVL